MSAGWSITWGTHTFGEAELTGAHLGLIVQILGGDTWKVSPACGPLATMATLTAWLMLAESRSFADVNAELLKASALHLAEALSFPT